MKNKGFSLIELIIVIAIMAIMAGFLAPALVKYINKSRLSVDIDTGRTLATAIMSALVDENARDGAQVHDGDPQNVKDLEDAAFKQAVFDIAKIDTLEGKSKKAVDGDTLDQQFYYTLDPAKNKVEIYYGGKTQGHMVYPQTGNKLIDQ